MVSPIERQNPRDVERLADAYEDLAESQEKLQPATRGANKELRQTGRISRGLALPFITGSVLAGIFGVSLLGIATSSSGVSNALFGVQSRIENFFDSLAESNIGRFTLQLIENAFTFETLGDKITAVTLVLFALLRPWRFFYVLSNGLLFTLNMLSMGMVILNRHFGRFITYLLFSNNRVLKLIGALFGLIRILLNIRFLGTGVILEFIAALYRGELAAGRFVHRIGLIISLARRQLDRLKRAFLFRPPAGGALEYVGRLARVIGALRGFARSAFMFLSRIGAVLRVIAAPVLASGIARLAFRFLGWVGVLLLVYDAVKAALNIINFFRQHGITPLIQQVKDLQNVWNRVWTGMLNNIFIPVINQVIRGINKLIRALNSIRLPRITGSTNVLGVDIPTFGFGSGLGLNEISPLSSASLPPLVSPAGTPGQAPQITMNNPVFQGTQTVEDLKRNILLAMQDPAVRDGVLNGVTR